MKLKEIFLRIDIQFFALSFFMGVIFFTFGTQAQSRRPQNKSNQRETIVLKPAVRASANKTQPSRSVAGRSAQKSKKPFVGLPKKSIPSRESTPPQNQQAVVGASIQDGPAFRGDGKTVVPVYLYSATGEMTGAIFNGMQVGDQMLAVKLSESLTFIDLLSNYRLFHMSEDRSFNELILVSLNFENKFALMKMSKPDLKNFVFSWPKVIAPSVAVQFGMNSSQEMMDVLNRMRSDLQRDPSRQTASSNRNPAAVIESRLLWRAQKLTTDFIQSTDPVRIGKNVLATKPPGTRCGPRSPEVSTSALQQQVTTAWAMDCSWNESFEVSSQVRQYFAMTSGLLTLKDGNLFSDDKRLQLVQELAESNEKNMQQLSKNVQYSTQSLCERSFLTDRRVDVYYCTRNYKLLPALSDSFVIMGVLRGNEYLYTLVRSSGFSAEMNQGIANKVLTSLGRNL